MNNKLDDDELHRHLREGHMVGRVYAWLRWRKEDAFEDAKRRFAAGQSCHEIVDDLLGFPHSQKARIDND